jgi:hypothetical protein
MCNTPKRQFKTYLKGYVTFQRAEVIIYLKKKKEKQANLFKNYHEYLFHDFRSQFSTEKKHPKLNFQR